MNIISKSLGLEKTLFCVQQLTLTVSLTSFKLFRGRAQLHLATRGDQMGLDSPTRVTDEEGAQLNGAPDPAPDLAVSPWCLVWQRLRDAGRCTRKAARPQQTQSLLMLLALHAEI